MVFGVLTCLLLTDRYEMKKRNIIIAAISLLALLIVGIGFYILARGFGGRSDLGGVVAGPGAGAPLTTPVRQGTLLEEMRLTGTLSYGEPEPLPIATGTITGLPAAGQLIGQGEQIFAVDGAPVVLFNGTMPFWRDLLPTDAETIAGLEAAVRAAQAGVASAQASLDASSLGASAGAIASADAALNAANRAQGAAVASRDTLHEHCAASGATPEPPTGDGEGEPLSLEPQPLEPQAPAGIDCSSGAFRAADIAVQNAEDQVHAAQVARNDLNAGPNLGPQTVGVENARLALREAESALADARAGVYDANTGADVRQLEENLAALGFLNRAPGNTFNEATRAAIRAWQRSLGVDETGVFRANSVVVADLHTLVVEANPQASGLETTAGIALTTEFETTPPTIRVAEVTSRLGDQNVSPGSFTGAQLVAEAGLTAAQANTLTVGTPVNIALPNSVEASAEVSEVHPGFVDANGTMVPARAVVELSGIDAPLGAIRITAQTGTGPQGLIVPASAILAAPDGGYAVDVWTGSAIERVSVDIVAVADAQVLLSGDIEAGMEVVLAR